MPKLTPYQVTITADGVPDVVGLLDSTPVSIPSGYGGWTVINRERRVGLTQWQGKDPLRMAIPILLDGVSDQTSQEFMISHLSRMALPPKGGGEPPVVNVEGRGVPKPGPVDWVIENLQWGSNVVWDFASNGVMARLRQDVVVNLLEYRGDERATFGKLAPGNVTGKSTTGWPKTYIVKKGDTLQKIAAMKKFYGDASKWKKIADANGIRDPRNLKVGRPLRIPAP